ncbi:MAG: hypothetical protein R3D60_04840 [Paracoccaceae bacterium]
MTTRSAQAIKPSTLPGAMFGALLAGALYGATSSQLPFLKFNLLVLLGGSIIVAILHAGLRRAFVLNLAVSLISAALAVGAMWAVWFGFEQGFDRLVSVVSSGPKAITETIRMLGSTTTIRVSTGSTTAVHGPDEVRLAWLLQTLTMASAPVLGALLSPMVKRRAAAQAS